MDLGLFFMDLARISMIQLLPSSVMGLLAGRMVAGWLARHGFTWFLMDFLGFSWIWKGFQGFRSLGARFTVVPLVPDLLWRPECPTCCGGKLWPLNIPKQYHAQSLGLAGWQDGGWLDGWMAGWLDG